MSVEKCAGCRPGTRRTGKRVTFRVQGAFFSKGRWTPPVVRATDAGLISDVHRRK
jgi:hypothetical protein